MCNIILIGFMGAGKTSVGRKLAEKRHMHFLDIDSAIEEKQGRKITEIFSEHGEVYFRSLETEMLKKLLHTTERTVISTGGGLPIKKENHEYLKKLGYVIYLKANSKSLLKRLKGDNMRPLLEGSYVNKKVEALLTARIPAYEQAADAVIETDNKTIKNIIIEVEEQLNESFSN